MNAIESFKGRLDEDGDALSGCGTHLSLFRVAVYRNLGNHVPQKWSILDMYSGLVIGHSDHVILKTVGFHVGKAGHEKVGEQGCKNVHAYARGFLDVESMTEWANGSGQGFGGYMAKRRISYNPYSQPWFYSMLDDADGVSGPVREYAAETVCLTPEGQMYAAERLPR